MSNIPQSLYQFLGQSQRLWLFLDYDGTLAEFAPTPEHVNPNPGIAELVENLASDSCIRVAIISGRRLSHVERLVPVKDAFLAGTYGIELRIPGGKRVDRLDYATVRPTLTELKPHWAKLIDGREGFFLEDKGWSLAIHGRFAAEEEAVAVMSQARKLVDQTASSAPLGLFQLLDGHKFLEIGPQLAHKGETVRYLLLNHLWPKAQLLYLGDDDKDEVAFKTIHLHGGKAIVVASQPRETVADGRLDSPQAARNWLAELPQRLDLDLTQGKRDTK